MADDLIYLRQSELNERLAEAYAEGRYDQWCGSGKDPREDESAKQDNPYRATGGES